MSVNLEKMKVIAKPAQGPLAAASSAAPAQTAIAPVVLLDEEGRIVDITADAAAMLGYEPEALVGRALSSLAAPGWKSVADDATVRIRSGTTTVLEVMLCGRSGRRTLVQMRAREIDSPGRPSGTYVVAWSQQFSRSNGNGSACRNDEELRRLAYGLLTNHEEERSRVAKELLDGVVPLVFMAKLMIEDGLQRLKSGSSLQATEVLAGALGRLRDVSHEVRRISMDLRPRMLEDLGLLPTIEWYCRTFCGACSTARVERRLSVNEDHIDAQLKLEIFRILQEALNNVAQHAAARNVFVELTDHGEELRLVITDDGVGFNAEQLVFGNACPLGVGLQSIRKRICATKGRLILESAPGAGTKVGAIWAH